MKPECACTVVGTTSVLPFPSIRTVTAGPAASAPAGTARARRIAPNRANGVLLFIWATPFHEGCWLVAGGWSPGLWAYLPRLPGGSSPPVACAAGVPNHSGGSAPDSHRLPMTTDLEHADRTRTLNTAEHDRQSDPHLHPAGRRRRNAPRRYEPRAQDGFPDRGLRDGR